MKIKRLVIENFKSIERIELLEPNPFTVFVGPNGSGKSNIFEALEFVNVCFRNTSSEAIRLFGGDNIKNQKKGDPQDFLYESLFDEYPDLVFLKFNVDFGKSLLRSRPVSERPEGGDPYEQFYLLFSRIFLRNTDRIKINYQDDLRLNIAATNLEKVLKRILLNEVLRNEIFEWLELFVPEFKSVEIVKSQFSSEETLLFYEQYSDKPFTKNLISDGTYNILALLTAVYQSDDKPQFLCIEEPENGLHPQVAGELVDFFRTMCEERGHYIWLNTHSQTMASRVRPEELVIVDKRNGATQVKQFGKDGFFGMRADEAWLTNALNGGLPW